MTLSTLLRHALGLVVALAVLMAMPFLTTAVLTMISNAVGMRLGFHIYDVAPAGQHPAALGVLVSLACVSAICVLGELVRRRWSFLSWALPLAPALPMGAWMAFVSRGGDIPPALPVVLGATAGALVFLLVGAYWYILVLTPDGKRSV